MRLEEVLPAYREGKKIRRAYWAKGDGYIRKSGRRLLLSLCDIDADDWEIVQETHDWAWASEQLREGNRVKRLAWSSEPSRALFNGSNVLSVRDTWATDWVEA